MCKSNRYVFVFLSAFCLLCAAGALRAEEAPEPAAYMPMYLISETELSSIERYKTKSEAEKQSWLSQARKSKAQVETLLAESKILSGQLAGQRELNRKLQQSFNELEAERLTLISTKNGEIAGLKQAAADKTLEAEKQKNRAARMLAIIIAAASAVAGYAAVRVLRLFRVM